MTRANALSGPTPTTPSPSPSARTANTPQTARKEANKQVKAPAPAGGPGSGDTLACPNSAAHGEILCPRLEHANNGKLPGSGNSCPSRYTSAPSGSPELARGDRGVNLHGGDRRAWL